MKSIAKHPLLFTWFSTLFACIAVSCQAGEYVATGASQTVAAGTQQPAGPPLQVEDFIRKVSQRLDAIEKNVEEWGHGSISGLEPIPLLSGQDLTESLSVGGNRNYADVLKDVKESVQGGASLFDQGSLTLGLAARANVDEVAKPSQELLQSQDKIARDRVETARKEEKEIATLVHQQRLETERLNLQKLRETAAQEATNSEAAPSESGTSPAAAPASSEALPADSASASDALFSTPVASLPDGSARPPAPRETKAFNNDDLFGGRLLPSPLANLPFSTFQALNNNTGPARAMSPAEAAAQAKSIGIQERLTDLIANPIAVDGNRAVYLAIAQVSVSPGWRTKQGYACEVSLRAELVKEATAPSGNIQVSVFGMFPQARSQTLDLAYSKRWQFQFLMNLAGQYAAAGQEANGRAVLDYVRRMEKDVDTLSNLPVLVPNSDGTQVTYRFDPSLQALADPASNSTKPANILHATSVPVLLAMSCDKEDVKTYPKLRVRMTSRWLPLEKRHWAKKIGFDWWYYAYSRDGRRSEREIFNDAKQLDEVVSLMYQYSPLLGDEKSIAHTNLRHALLARYRILEPYVSGNIITRSMPKPKEAKPDEKKPPAPTIVNLSPASLKEGSTSFSLSIRIQDFGEVKYASKFKVYLGGEVADAAYDSRGVLTATFTQTQSLPPGEIDLFVARTDEDLSAATKLKIIPLEKPKPVPDEIKPDDISFSPSTGHLFATTSLFVQGKAFQNADGKAAVKGITVGGRECTFDVISPKLLKVTIPSWMDKPAAGTPVPQEISESVVITDGEHVITSTKKITFKPNNVSDPNREPISEKKS